MIDQYAVLGNPIHHSLSPRIHRLFAEETQQQLEYKAILVPFDELPQTLDDFEVQGGKGLNITLPFKEEAFRLVHTLSDRAKRAKAINTIRFDADGQRWGDNTDGIGLVRDLELNHHYAISGKRILILGAGGAVRGILAPLLAAHPAELVIVNRTFEKARALAAEFGDLGQLSACRWEALNDQAFFDLVIHGTSLGVNQGSLNLPTSLLSPAVFCYDLSYSQHLTPFLRWASDGGVRQQSDGLGMLVEQAAEAFYGWRGVKPSATKVLRAL